MSIVGPRPALPAEVATYDDYQRQRLLVKPGMTCYWQTRRNRDSITFDEWVDLDLWAISFLSESSQGTIRAIYFEGKTVKQHSEDEYVTVYAIYKRRQTSAAIFCWT